MSPCRAGFWPRLMAHNIDLMVLLPNYYLVSLFIESTPLLLAICAAFTYLYDAVASVSVWQGSVGKKLMRLRIVNRQGNRLVLQTGLLRSLAKTVTVLTLFVGYAVIMLHPRNLSIHDIIAGTEVIFSQKS